MTTTLERPGENRVADTERALLDAALAEVTEHGIRRTTVADIARKAVILSILVGCHTLRFPVSS